MLIIGNSTSECYFFSGGLPSRRRARRKRQKKPEPATKPPARKSDGEIRSYYFPPGAVHLEKELLSKYRANDFQGLLEEAHTLLIGLVKIMKSVHKDARVKGYVIASLGAQLDHASALLLRMRNAYDGVMPVRR